jgi:diguanylate cyclase (GGDEF)-like protein
VARQSSAHGGPPRLILRFAVWTCVALALAAAAILLVVRYYNTVQAERAATSQTRVLASAVLRGAVVGTDFRAPISTARQAELDRFFEARILGEGFLLARLYRADGTLAYSTDHHAAAPEREHVREALDGVVRGDVATLSTATGRERRVLRTYAPVPIDGGAGVVALFQDYEPIARAATATFVPVVGIFEAVLVLLFVALVPILRHVMRRVRRQMDEIEHRARYDELTELPNRTHFRERIEERLESEPVAVLLLDLDRFKEINDALGHEAGDLLLRLVGSRLAAELGDAALLARLGGDEFGILVAGTAADATSVASDVHRVLERPFAVLGLPIEVATSIGIAVSPDHGHDADALLQRADVAMYLAKAAHAGTAVYDEQQDVNDADRLALAGELRRAIENDELVLHYQPKASLETGRIVGVEALVRWVHPERGFIPPDEFIPLAERTGLIKPLSRHVVAAALRQCEAWNALGLDLHVAVNLTIPDLLDVELPDRVAALLAETRVRPDQLEFEITESTILADPFRVRQVLSRFDELGVGLAIDDFGTGYSSFAVLKSLPVATIKIDRSFVMGMCDDESDATIVRSTIDLARNLGLDVVAEGVESEEAWDALRAHGCSLAQGYFISRPVPADELVGVLNERLTPRPALSRVS